MNSQDRLELEGILRPAGWRSVSERDWVLSNEADQQAAKPGVNGSEGWPSLPGAPDHQLPIHGNAIVMPKLTVV